jgi:hypothetical protein
MPVGPNEPPGVREVGDDIVTGGQRPVYRLEVKAAWRPHEHPRDSRGRFIKNGSHVRIMGGATGTVVGQPRPGSVTVERDSDHQRRNYPAGYLTVLDAAPAPTPSAPRPERGRLASPLTDEEYEAHTRDVEERLGAALKAGEATDVKHTLNGDGVTYTPERAAKHKEIVDELASRYTHVPSEGKAVIAGGLGGAGKSTVLGKFAGIDQDEFATLNPDDVKELMVEKGLVPDIPGLSPMEAAPIVHEESSLITNMLAQRMYRERKNVIWDITMSRRGSVEKRIDELRSHGYDDLEAVFVDIPVETSVERALARHRRGLENYRAGKGTGGRYVPPAIIRKAATAGTSSANREVFDSLRGSFDRWSMYDNSVRGRDPKRIGGSSRR